MITRANLLSIKPGATDQAFKLYEEIVDKNGKLSAYLVLNGVETTYSSTCLEFAEQAQQLRQLLNKSQEAIPTARVRASSVNENLLSPTARNRPVFASATDHTDKLHCHEGELDSAESCVQNSCHGSTSAETIQAMLDQLHGTYEQII